MFSSDSKSTSCPSSQRRPRRRLFVSACVAVLALSACSSTNSPEQPSGGGSPGASGAAGAATVSGGPGSGGSAPGGTAGSAPGGAGAASAQGNVAGNSAGGAGATGDGPATGGSAAGGPAGSSTSGSGGQASGGAGLAGASAGGTGGTGGTSTGALHVDGNVLKDGNATKVMMRGPELVIRWGTYAGLTSAGVDVPWEGGTNNNVGSATIREIAKTGANAVRVYGGIGNGLDAILNTAIVEQKMFVGVGRVDWTNAQMKATLDKYKKYIFIHPRGEFTYSDDGTAATRNKYATEAKNAIQYIRSLGYTQAIEIGTIGYGQAWGAILAKGQEVAAVDPLKNTFFLLQLYSEYATRIPQTMTEIAAFPHPVTVDACLFTSTYGNTPNTYKEVWDQSFAKGFGSFYWDWWGDGEGNSMTSSGTFSSLNDIGKYIVDNGQAALKNTVKTPFLLNAQVP